MITTAQFKTLDDLYGFCNNALFGGLLPECIVNMSRHKGTYGFFPPEDGEAQGAIRPGLSMK
jgi:hypothetical protein